MRKQLKATIIMAVSISEKQKLVSFACITGFKVSLPENGSWYQHFWGMDGCVKFLKKEVQGAYSNNSHLLLCIIHKLLHKRKQFCVAKQDPFFCTYQWNNKVVAFNTEASALRTKLKGSPPTIFNSTTSNLHTNQLIMQTKFNLHLISLCPHRNEKDCICEAAA